MSKIQSYINYIADPRARRSIRSIFASFLKDDDDMTFRGITFSKGDTDTGLDAASIIEHGTYSTALAYGTQTSHLVLQSSNITAGATGVYVFGNINRITTSAASTGYMNCGYDYLSVGHNLTNGWATRGRVALTATCEVGEMSGLLGTCEVTGTTAITATGSPVLAAAILDLDIAATATVAQEVTCLEVRPHIRANIAGSSAGIRVNINCSTANYLDYGIDIRSMSANQTAAMRILFTGASASLGAAIIIEGQDSSSSAITNGIRVNGTAMLNFAKFASGAAGTHCIFAATDACVIGTKFALQIDIGGVAHYIPVFDDYTWAA